MSSKFGARPLGTDGSDFRHRQRVAAHYRESVTNKTRLKWAVCVNVLMFVVMLLKLVEDILDRFDIDWGPLERLKVPEPFFWEYWWLLSLLPAIGALTSLPRNNERRLRRCYYGFFIFGLVPVAVGAGRKLPEFLDYLRERRGDVFLGFPEAVIWFIFFAVAFQAHVFSMYFASNLIKAWQPSFVKPTTSAGNDEKNGTSIQNDRKHK